MVSDKNMVYSTAQIKKLSMEELEKLHECPMPYIWVPDKQGSGLTVLKWYSYRMCGMIATGLLSLLAGSSA